jgi:putative ABC transport system permease protein
MTSFKVGLFLAIRQLRRANIWTNILISFVMVLTFLNLVVINGILVGLIQGSEEQYKDRYTGDVIVSKLISKPYIQRTSEIITAIESMPGIKDYVVRYTEGGSVQADYKENIKKEGDLDMSTGALFSGIDPVKENEIFGLADFVVEGEYLQPGDFDKVMIGANLLYRYIQIDSPVFRPLKGDIGPGDKVRVTIGDTVREVEIKGIVKTKVDEISSRIFMDEAQLRQIAKRSAYDANEISIIAEPGVTQESIRDALLARGFGEYATIQTQKESIPVFLDQIKDTFGLLGNAMGLIGLVVASITIFIVIFVNIITRRKYIGILKGIGVSGKAIEISYIFQSAFYAIVGSAIGLVLTFFVLRPLFYAHPIDFPFSDGILAVTWTGTLVRAAILIVCTIIAGYIPARMIVRRNTLDSILGR